MWLLNERMHGSLILVPPLWTLSLLLGCFVSALIWWVLFYLIILYFVMCGWYLLEVSFFLMWDRKGVYLEGRGGTGWNGGRGNYNQYTGWEKNLFSTKGKKRMTGTQEFLVPGNLTLSPNPPSDTHPHVHHVIYIKLQSTDKNSETPCFSK